jgi:hypothetical protein
MREYKVPALFLLFFPILAAQTVPPGWKVVRDSKSLCQVAVPPEWAPLAEEAGAAVFKDSTTAIAVVTSQPGQAFKPLPESLQKVMDIPKDKLFENTAKRTFYQDRTSRNPETANAYSASVPGKGGTCNCHVVFLPSVSEEIARKITLSLGPAPE